MKIIADLISALRNKKWQIFLATLFFVIFFRYGDFLFFTWDQGRDAFKLASIVNGDLTLIGPTSGLQGFFLGPLWYYIGIPGFILGQGNPYIISFWYSLLTFSAIPALALIIKQIFPNKNLYWLSLFLIFFSPGFIKATTMIWNPLLSVPLLAWAIYALIQPDHHSLWVFIGFSLLGLLLQSEFAYGVFLAVGLFLTLKFYQPQAKIKDFFFAGLGISWTLLPQFIFDLRNNWLISRSLLLDLSNPEVKVSYLYLMNHRPNQILGILAEQIFGSSVYSLKILMGILTLLSLYFFVKLLKKNKISNAWRLIYLIFFLPLIGYSIWHGNYGNLFSYYITPHFIPFYLILVHLFSQFSELRFKIFNIYCNKIILIFLIFINFSFSLNRILQKKVDAGLTNSIEAIEAVYEAAKKKNISQPVLRIFVPNRETEHYDYLTKWYAQTHNLPIANTMLTSTDQNWYILIEPDHEIPEKRFVPWYQKNTKNGIKINQWNYGILSMEEWQKNKL